MAKLIANQPINMATFAIGDFIGTATDFSFTKDLILVNYANMDQHRFEGKFGINIAAKTLSGTATLWKFYNTTAPDVPYFQISEAKIPATKLLKAGLTAVTTDDQAVLAETFKGNDDIQGSAFADTLLGYKGNDTVKASLGDVADGGDGTDTIQFGAVGVTLTLVKGGNSPVTGGGFARNFENVIGSSAADTITGDIQNNMLKGEGDNDFLDGSVGNDSVDGGAGMDTVIGGSGKDVLTGGADADTFRYLTTADAPKGEVINDFVAFDGITPGDKLDLSAIDAMASASPGVDNDFIIDGLGTSKSAVAEGHISWYFVDKSGTVNDRTFVRINADSNAKIDMTLELKGIVNLSATDFIV